MQLQSNLGAGKRIVKDWSRKGWDPGCDGAQHAVGTRDAVGAHDAVGRKSRHAEGVVSICLLRAGFEPRRGCGYPLTYLNSNAGFRKIVG
jgi:hypothetical protein